MNLIVFRIQCGSFDDTSFPMHSPSAAIASEATTTPAATTSAGSSVSSNNPGPSFAKVFIYTFEVNFD